MKRFSHTRYLAACVTLPLLPIALVPSIASAGCVAEISDAEVFELSMVVAEVQVISATPFLAETGKVNTRFVLSAGEKFKGKLPESIEIISPGGTLGTRTDYGSNSISLKTGKSYVLMLNQDDSGNWSASPFHTFEMSAKNPKLPKFFRNQARGDRPVSTTASRISPNQDVTAAESEIDSDQSASGIPGSRISPTGYSENTPGEPTRFTTGDADEAIPYLIDIDPTKLPSGMNQAGAIAAVAEAFDVWAKSSSLRFRFDGVQSFGKASNDFSSKDGIIRVQLHDNFNSFSNPKVLGIGGGIFSTGSNFEGGFIGTQGFQERFNGFVVMESDPIQTNVNTFKRVLTHEIGHSLGLAHSSEDLNEPEVALKEATMYFQSPVGTVGVSIQAYDVDRIQFGYPISNMPPFVPDRIIRVVSTDPFFGALPIGANAPNTTKLRSFSRDRKPLTARLGNNTSNAGTFTLADDALTFTTDGFRGSAPITPARIEAGDTFETAAVRFSDGTNTGVGIYKIVELSADRTPLDGLPDSWMIANFGNIAIGVLGSGRHQDDDPDKDGLTNRMEFLLNTDPNSAASGAISQTYDHATRQLKFTPIPFANYWVESSTTLTADSWNVRKTGTYDRVSGNLSLDFKSSSTPTAEFYRVGVSP